MNELTDVKKHMNDNRLFVYMNNENDVHDEYYLHGKKVVVNKDEFSFTNMVMDFFGVEEEEREYFSVPLLLVSAAVHTVLTIK